MLAPSYTEIYCLSKPDPDPREAGRAIHAAESFRFVSPTKFQYAHRDAIELKPLMSDVWFHEIKTYSADLITISHDCYRAARKDLKACKDTLFWIYHRLDESRYQFMGFIRFSVMVEESLVGSGKFDGRTMKVTDFMDHRLSPDLNVAEC